MALARTTAKTPTPVPAADVEDTRERIMQVATQLFATNGFHSVSLRRLTQEANVNLASVGYHFGSKEGLVAAIFAKHCEPMMAHRREMLLACADKRGRPPMLEQLIEAFIVPALITTEDAADRATFTRLRAVLAHENNELAHQLISKYFDATSTLFVEALHRCVPHLSREDVLWRFHFLLSALYYTTVNPMRIQLLSGGKIDPTDQRTAVTEMVRFVAAGFRAK
jgi:AcrR family transcriptional regulator